MDRQMEKQKVTYTYNGISFNHNREGNCDPGYNMDEPQKYYIMLNKQGAKAILHDFS
jgi:hypothetical protein